MYAFMASSPWSAALRLRHARARQAVLEAEQAKKRSAARPSVANIESRRIPLRRLRAADELLSIADRAASAGVEAMSMEEVDAEVKAVRASRRQRAGGH
jgi:hypothetical protein